MLITTPWLLQYLATPVSHDALMEAFPRIGLEIEESKKLESGDGFLVDLNVLANRPDELGIIGIAREVAAHFNGKLKYPVVTLATGLGNGGLSVEILDPDLCPRYMGAVITGVNVGPSPKWMQDILVAIEQRPINNVVDITNYVMFEYGQPLHAFDFARIAQKKIVVRKLAAGEKLELLGGKTIDAGPANAQPALAICDAERPVALAGIMGGKQSETRPDTTDILLEAANFDPPTVRRTAKRIEVSTESSYRFERGCDPNRMLEGALARASQLLVELAGGKIVGLVDGYPKKREPRTFKLSADRVSNYLGNAISDKTIEASLQKLEMKVSPDLVVQVPTWRMDAVDPVVLIEDVARLVGYDALPMRPTSQNPTLGIRSSPDALRQELSGYLSSVGYFECRSPSLDTPEQVTALLPDVSKQVKLKNPMSREASVMRPSLLPALVRVAERNTRRGATTTRFFEIDRTYTKRTNDPNEPGAIENWMAAGVAGGASNEFDWTGHNPAVSFFDVKGALQDVLELAGVRNAQFAPSDRVGFVKETCASILSASDPNGPIGFVGEIDGNVIPLGKIAFKLFGFELDLAELLKTHAAVANYKPLARTPAVWRDLAIVVKSSENYARIDRAIRDAAGGAFETLHIVDLYQGKQVAAGFKSLAFRLTFRDPARTLTAEEVQAFVDCVVQMLKTSFQATLRE